jgi:sugar/nucleoside kinase (ribokinase family)
MGRMIVVYGTVCLDRVRRVPRLPASGGYAHVLGETELLGGEAANTSLALSTWGAEIALLGNPIGRGPQARRLRRLIEKHGLPANGILVSGTVTPVCDIYVTPDGERTMFGLGFREMTRAADLTAAPLRAGAWFTADSNHGEAARDAVRRAAAAGMRVYLLDFLREDDPAPPGSFWQSSTDSAGVKGNTQRNVAWLRDWVAARGCFAVLSDGPNGFVAGSPEQPVRAYAPFPAPRVVDSTGAGDIFRAGMLFGLDQGWTLPDALRFASAAGSLICASLGATASVPSRGDVEAWIAAHPEIGRTYG